MDCTIVDVFAERPLCGNQLAVMRNCGQPETETMQAIAREMNFSETTFVLEESETEARVRIFTPTRELPFAGHPTLGTAWVLGVGRDDYALKLDAGRVAVTFGPGGMAWMTPPPAQPGATLPDQTGAALLGLSPEDIHTGHPCRFAEAGPRFVLVGVKTLDALRRIEVDTKVHAELAFKGEFLGVFAFTDEARGADADFAARMFFEAGGWREDPATGSANTALAAHLRELGVRGAVVVEQGFEIARPSRLYLDVGDVIRVGGKVRRVLTGVLHL